MTAAVVVGVVGARGGAGATTVAAVVARGLAERCRSVTLVDLAPWSGGLDVTLGIEQEPGLRWSDLQDARGRVDGAQVRARLPRWGPVAVVTAGRSGPAGVPAAAVPDVLAALVGVDDALVLDLPRGVGAVDLVECAPSCTEVLIVTPLDVLAVAGAVVLREVLGLAGAAVALVTRGPAPGRLDPAAVAAALDLDLAAHVSRDRGLAVAIEQGLGPGAAGPLGGLGRSLAARYVAIAGGGR